MATEGDIELEQEQDVEKERETEENKSNDNAISTAENMKTMSRKEKRKFLKKMRRKQLRRDTAIREREIAETMANDPEIAAKLRLLEEEEAERMERDRREFEERERRFVESLQFKKRQQEEVETRKRDEEAKRDLVNDGDEHEGNEGEDWEYVEEGPAEIIWKGNEIIVKKKKVKVPKKVPNLEKEKQESEGPISNPLAPQSEAFEDYKSAQEVLDSVAQQVPNFGTEQDKAHCPFHLKTGVCRFGARCSRVHFYPDKSCTILIKNMYSGPGLAWEQDEELEHTDEEVERSFEEFYEDVHTEFLKFGEIVNFKVCKNASSHLRGNVYVHYKLLEAAVLAYQSMNGRYFAGKQLSCEFVNLTRWKVAICGEYMKSRLKTCSRGSVCNFIHCFRNPGGDYEWADWEKPPPRYWLKEMAALFGYSNDRFTDENLSYHRKRSRSRGPDSPHKKSPSDEDGLGRSKYLQRHKGDREEKISTTANGHVKRRITDKREHESSLCKRKEAYSSYIDSSGDSLLRDTHTHDSRKRSKMKNEVDLSDNSSGSRSGRDGSSRKRIRSISKSKNKSDYREYKRKSDSLERNEDRSHNHSRKSSRLMSVIDESRIERDENKHQRNRTQSQGSGKQSDFTDSESEIHRYRTDGKRRRSTKCSRKGKHDAESSDNASEGSRSLRSEKRLKRGRRRSRSKNDFDFLDDESNVRGRNREERQGGTVRTNDIVHNEKSGFQKIDFVADKCPADLEKLKEKEKDDASLYGPGNSIFDANVDSNLSEKGKIVDGPYLRNPEFQDPNLSRRSAESHDSCFEDLISTRGPQNDEMEHISPVNENDETTSSQTAEACFRDISCHNVASKAEAELEHSYRMAALKKWQEMRKSKDADIHIHENIVVEDAKDTRETRGADSRRRRI